MIGFHVQKGIAYENCSNNEGVVGDTVSVPVVGTSRILRVPDRTRSRARPMRLLASEAETSKASAVSVVLSGAQVILPMAGLFDVAAERERLEKQLLEAEAEAARLHSQLDNDEFRAKAPAKVVAAIEQKYAATRDRIERIKRSLAELGSL